MFELHSQGYRDTVDILVRENNSRADKIERLFKAMEKRFDEELRGLRESLQFSQAELDEYKAKVLSLEKQVEDKDNQLATH